MKSMEERSQGLLKEINNLHESVSQEKWGELNKTGLVFELERSLKKLKEIFQDFSDINRELSSALEKNSPDLSDFLEEFGKQIDILESNLKMEKQAGWKENIVNEYESFAMPELYSSLQEKVLSLSLKARYSAERISLFVNSKKVPPNKKGSTARNLIEVLEKREQEIQELKEKQAEMRRRSFLGFVQEKNVAELEGEVSEMDKGLSQAVSDVNNAMKIHFSQMEYLEGSFSQLREKVGEIEERQHNFSKKAVELVKDLKKERDYAKKTALDIEQETMNMRGEYTRKIINAEEEKQAVRERAEEKCRKEIEELKEENKRLKEEMKNKEQE